MSQQPDGIRRDADLHGVTTILPPPTETPPPDEFGQAVHYVFLTIGLYVLYLMCNSVALTVLRDSGFYAWYYGREFVAGAFDPQQPLKAAQTRLQLWAIATALPFWLVPTAIVFGFLPSAYRYDIGVSPGRFGQREDSHLVHSFARVPRALAVNLLLGIGAWLLIAPLAFGVNWLLAWLYQRYTEVTPEEHPLTVTATSGAMRPLEWGLLAFNVMVSAPLWEELLFRGLLPAACRKLRGNGGHAAMTLALAAAVVLRGHQIAEALPKGVTPLLLAAVPALFVAAMTPIYALVCWRSRTDNGPIVFGTALLFAAVHSFAWPTPVALFILGLGLGWLAVWTRSLLAPIVVHALFNAISFALLYFGVVTM